MRRWAERLLEAATLSEAGRPVLRAGEFETQLIDRVDIEIDGASQDEVLRSGTLILTNARIFWVHDQSRCAFSLPLVCVSKTSIPKRGLKNVFATPRLKLELWISANGRLCPRGAAGADNTAAILLVFRGHSSHESFTSRLAALLQSKEWESIPPLPSPSWGASPSSSSALVPAASSSMVSSWNPSRAGVSGILLKEQELWEKADKDLQEAFHNLTALMGKAKEMVMLADRMRAKLLSGDSSSDSAQEMQEWFLSVGIVSPVTKESAGALYHQQLSRQLADFAWSPLQNAGGMLFVIDLYCMFNRARGTEQISPDDMLQACRLWERLDVPLKLCEYESGALIVQTKSKSDEAIFASIMVLVGRPENSQSGVGAHEASKCLGIEVTLAKQQLLAAEKRGLLCRDDAPDELKFFVNFFKDAQL